jgi:hypothetical protein
LLNSTRVGVVRGQTLYLVANNPAFIGLLKRPADKDIIEKAIARAGLGTYEVNVVGPDDPVLKTAAAEEPAPNSEPVSPLVEQAIRVFGKENVIVAKEENA